ncbi:CsbD family protein [Alkalinema sp. FACHB-956]|uniref:CsbD family protein n=1 Tax=Alkalinema sp. FACHB-956 TaxID=2692768 RepID=UPI0016856FFF|nr:CsbD family protein [Alkalinema sp. FACHB-956]
MSLEGKAKATAKNLEGKAQEAIGHVTGDPVDQHEGKAKQSEAKVRHSAENLKEKAQNFAEGVQTRVEAAAKNVAGKIEEAVGEATDDPTKVAKGRMKQTEADALNAAEDIRR